MAFERRRPDQHIIHHADRATCNTRAFGQRLHELGFAASFGSTGDAYGSAGANSPEVSGAQMVVTTYRFIGL